MNAFALMRLSPASATPFHIEIVGDSRGAVGLASGVPVKVQRTIDTIEASDIVIVRSVVLGPEGWRKGRYPRLVEWLRQMYDRGAVLCSACSGIFLLAETGLFDGRDATVHFSYARTFATLYPAVPIHPERVLLISGAREELVSSGASSTWHDMVLHLIARYAGSASAQEVARLFALQWHHDGLTPYIVFEGKTDRGDAHIQRAQMCSQPRPGKRPVAADRRDVLAEDLADFLSVCPPKIAAPRPAPLSDRASRALSAPRAPGRRHQRIRHPAPVAA